MSGSRRESFVYAADNPILVHNTGCSLPGTKFDVPEKPGVYTVHLNDGQKYVGSSTVNMRGRVNSTNRSGHAVRRAGYEPEDVVNVTHLTLPSGTSRATVRRIEQTMMDGVKEGGGSPVNRRDPEIPIPSGGYFP